MIKRRVKRVTSDLPFAFCHLLIVVKRPIALSFKNLARSKFKGLVPWLS